jgi:hypothetical protein
MKTVADGHSMLSLCYRTEFAPTASLWVSTNVADTLDRQPYATKNGQIFEDTRSHAQIEKATAEFLKHVKPVIKPGGLEAKASIGQLL